MKTFFKYLVFFLIGLLVSSTAYAAASLLPVGQGGTGVGTLTSSHLLYGNGKNPLSGVATTSLSGGSGITFTGTAGALVGGTNLSVSIGSGAITNAMLVSDTISGITLGSNLNNLTFNNSGSGAASGQTYNGSTAETISYNTIGAQVAGSYDTFGWPFTKSTWGSLGVSATTTPILDYKGLVAATSTIGSLTATSSIAMLGKITLNGSQPATSTAIVLNWASTGPQLEYRIGTAATTITLINATTSLQWASRKLVVVCNPNAVAGAITWKGVEWVNATTPTQTTTANVCDTWSFFVTHATSTTAYKVFGAQSPNFQ